MEKRELGRLDQEEIIGTGVSLDPRQHHGHLQIADRGHLLHDVLAAQIVDTGLEDVYHALRDQITRDVESVIDVPLGIVLAEPGRILLESCRVNSSPLASLPPSQPFKPHIHHNRQRAHQQRALQHISGIKAAQANDDGRAQRFGTYG